MTRVAIVTSAALPDLDDDDRPLLPALAARGVVAVPVRWNDPAIDWRTFRCAVVRNPWDYHERYDEFVAWTHAVERAAVPLHNPAPVLRWNTHKQYLRELAAAGVPVVDTHWHTAGDDLDLAPLLARWGEIVVKPCISAGARNTHRVRIGAPAPDLTALAATRDLMIQPYLPTVESIGEHSLIHIGGALTHAIRKHAMLTPGHGEGGEPLVTPAGDELALARAVLAAVPHPAPLLYARVDMLRDPSGTVRLMELEVTEPRLFLRVAPAALAALADAVAAL